MDIKRAASAGTMESCDAYVMVAPDIKLSIEIRSPNLNLYGARMRSSVEEVIRAKDIRSGRFIIDDRGALDCTLRARVKSVIDAALCDLDKQPYRIDAALYDLYEQPDIVESAAPEVSHNLHASHTTTSSRAARAAQKAEKSTHDSLNSPSDSCSESSGLTRSSEAKKLTRSSKKHGRREDR